MDEALVASKGERIPERLSYRSGHYGSTLITRVGKLELRVPQDRAGRFWRSPRICAAMPSQPRRSWPSTSGWTRACSPLLSGRFKSRLPISSSTPPTRRYARPASS
ncbi:transposase [Mesorhizobium sp.]|uniref:transposase n=1 Tax=Mesorhizobium sp. TaxID=1871066 RepID=UPI0025EA544E|nr:transposase [Mesorhizobium sp.]